MILLLKQKLLESTEGIWKAVGEKDLILGFFEFIRKAKHIVVVGSRFVFVSFFNYP